VLRIPEWYWDSLTSLIITPEIVTIRYSILFSWVEGSNNSVLNPITEYTIEDEITLNDPNKTGYNFLGWTREWQAEMSSWVSLSTWEVWDKTFTAHWSEPISYDIHYENLSWAVNENPSTYTIETETITLENLQKTGYTFLWWYDSESWWTQVTQITKWSYGNKVLYARWSAEQKTVTVNSYEMDVNWSYPVSPTKTATLTWGTDETITITASWAREWFTLSW
jgi:hypothetical protein